MANINGGRRPADVWGRRIALCCFGAISATLIVTVLFASVLVMSGVLEW